MELLISYQTAYYSDRSYTAWLEGFYAYQAHSISLSNAFAKKGAQPIKYPEWKDPMDKFRNSQYTQEDIDNEFISQQERFSEWLNKK